MALEKTCIAKGLFDNLGCISALLLYLLVSGTLNTAVGYCCMRRGKLSPPSS